MTGTPRWRAAAPTTPTEWANSGPMMISAPSASACCAACCAPPEVPPSSLIRSWTFGLWNSTSAISAAFFIDSATVPALPAADSGRISPTLTAPVPIAAGCCTGPAGGVLLLNSSEVPEQAVSKASRPPANARLPSPRKLGCARRHTDCAWAWFWACEAEAMDDFPDSDANGNASPRWQTGIMTTIG